MAEKRFNLTPYHYVSNNPINRIDLFGLEDVNGDGKDDGTILPEVTVTARKRDISSSWSNYINNLGNEGYSSFKEIYREHKLSPYNSNFSGAIYGRDANGQVQIPDDILDRIDQEVDDEAMLALAMLWASEQSGVDPDSFNFDINPFARANFYNSYLSTGVSNEEAGSLVTSVGATTALAYAGNIKLSPFINVLKSSGGKINGFTIGTKGRYGAQPRFDFHPLGYPSKPKRTLTVPKWMKNRIPLPHYHRGKGSNLNYHRPWELDPNGKRKL